MSTVKEYEIGKKLYAVHKSHVKKQVNGAKVIIARVQTYAFINGEVQPILTIVGNSRHNLDATTHKLYEDLGDAITAISKK